ncbi:EI24 domain-containing protein [Shigella flexneri]
MVSSFTSAPRSGLYYLRKAGSSSRTLDSAFRYLPLLVNILLMGAIGGSLHSSMSVSRLSQVIVPDWLEWLSYLLWPLAVISVLLVFGSFFSTIANWIAALFNGLSGEQLEHD